MIKPKPNFDHIARLRRGEPRLSAPTWPDKHVATLRAAIEEGLSYGQVRKYRLPMYSRNAIIGKCHRLNIRESMSPETHRVRSAQHNNIAHFATRVRRGLITSSETRHPANMSKTNCATDAILALKDGEHCKWPIGDPKSPGFSFCGCKPKAGEPYCDAHHAAAYEPAAIDRPERLWRLADVFTDYRKAA